MWVTYRPGAVLIGKRIRIAGKPGDHNQGRNYFDNKYYNLPAGLVGLVRSITPFKIEFDRGVDRNSILWNAIFPVWSHQKMYAEISVQRLSAIEVET